MRVSWKRTSFLVAILAVIVAGTAAYADRQIKPSATKCPGNCPATYVCGGPGFVPKLCGETKDGPFFEATYPCCCCTPESKGRWFFGE